MPFETLSEALLFDLMFALRRAPFRAKPGKQLSDAETKLVAQAILQHLELAQWRFEKSPPTERH